MDTEQPSRGQRMAWFLALWLAGMGILALVAAAVRLLLGLMPGA